MKSQVQLSNEWQIKRHVDIDPAIKKIEAKEENCGFITSNK